MFDNYAMTANRQRNLKPEELLAFVPGNAPKGLKLNWNKTSSKWYYYTSSYRYDSAKKRSVEHRTLVGYLNKENQFVFTQRYLLSQQAARAAPSLPDKQAVDIINAARSECSEAPPDKGTPALIACPLDIIFVVAFLSSLAGGSNCMQIADYWKTHRKYLSNLFDDFPDKDISHDTVRRALSLCDSDKFEELLRCFARRFTNEVGTRIINFDGQAVQATKQTEFGKSGRHQLSFYDSSSAISLFQTTIDDKSNEIAAAQKLLPYIDLTDCVVAADAMHAQTKTVSLIIEQNGNYCIALKRNQGRLCEYAATCFERPGKTVLRHKTFDDGQAREETRIFEVLPGSMLPKSMTAGWPGLNEGTIVKVTAWRKEKAAKRESVAVRYYASSLVWSDPRCHLKLAFAIRQHWAIENSLQHVLDVILLQDAIQCKNITYLRNQTALNKLADNVRSKYRQWRNQNDEPEVSKSRLLKILSKPEEAIRAMVIAAAG